MEMRLGKGRILYQVNNYWRFDVYWLKPTRRPARRWLLKKAESSESKIHLEDLWRLIRVASPLVIVVDINEVSVAETDRLCKELSSRNPSTEVDLWAERMVNGRRIITYVTNLVEEDQLSIGSLYILAYLPQWERDSIAEGIREAFSWLSE